tara:strand:+ start:86 stop:358 length:273 start_codon:yes stop_codon:yes gene_type:complete
MRLLDVIEKGWNDNKRNRKSGNNSFFYSAEEDKFYSYNTEIAVIDRLGETMTIMGLTAEFGNFCSNTTSAHFGKIKKFCIDNAINFYIKS